MMRHHQSTERNEEKNELASWKPQEYEWSDYPEMKCVKRHYEALKIMKFDLDVIIEEEHAWKHIDANNFNFPAITAVNVSPKLRIVSNFDFAVQKLESCVKR